MLLILEFLDEIHDINVMYLSIQFHLLLDLLALTLAQVAEIDDFHGIILRRALLSARVYDGECASVGKYIFFTYD